MALVSKIKVKEFIRKSYFRSMNHEVSMSLLCMAGLLERLMRRNSFRGIKTNILNESKANLNHGSGLAFENLPPSSSRWNSLLGKMRNDISSFKRVKEAITYAQKKMPFDHRSNASALYNYFHLFEIQLHNEFPDFSDLIKTLGDSIYSRPQSLYKYGYGKLVSNVFYWHLRYFLTCLTYVKSPQSILEIGGGYGALARIWMTNTTHRPDIYVMIDFPETLFFAEVFLKLNLSDVNVKYIKDAKSLNFERAKNTIFLVPIQLANEMPNLGFAFDLAINTGSMQEMSEDWIDFWTNWIDKIHCRYFYSLNYAVSRLTDWREGANVWSPRFSKQWMLRLNRLNPYFIKLQCADNMAEIIAEKMPLEHQWDEDLLRQKYKNLQTQFFDLQNFWESLDIARVLNDNQILLSILERCEGLPFLPKESYWILDKLVNSASIAFLDKNKSSLEPIKNKILDQYSKAHKDYVHADALK